MLEWIPNGSFSEFDCAWKKSDGDDEKAALKKCLRISFYLLKNVWKVHDTVLAKEINAVHLPEGVKGRKFKHEWVKPLVKLALEGRDLSDREDPESVRHYPKGKSFSSVDVWRFLKAMQKIARESESVENSTDDDSHINQLRIEQIKKVKGSFLDQVGKIFEGIIEDVHIGADFDDGEVLKFTLFVRRLIEKKVELLLLTKASRADFMIAEYLSNRKRKTDADRKVNYPDEIMKIRRYLLSGEKAGLNDLLERIIA